VQDALISRIDTTVAKKLKSLRFAVHNRLPKQRTTTVTYKRGTAIRTASIFGTRSFRRVRRALSAFAVRQSISRDKKFRMGISARSEAHSFAKKFRLDGTAAYTARSNQKLGYFASSAGWQITRAADLARAAAMHTRVRRQAPFDNYRPYL
jgi:hypothetical protein